MNTLKAASSFSLLVLGCLWLAGCCLARGLPTYEIISALARDSTHHNNRRFLGSTDTKKTGKKAGASSKARSKVPRKRSPPPTPSPVEVCSAVTLSSPLDLNGKPVYTFNDPISCDDVAAFMSANWAQAATAQGVSIPVPFALQSCSGQYDATVSPPAAPSIVVCGSFSSATEAAKLQGELPHMMSAWKRFVLGLPLPDPAEPSTYYWCPPAGYVIDSAVWGDGDDAPLLAYERVQCSSSFDFGQQTSAEEESDEATAACTDSTDADAPFSLSTLTVSVHTDAGVADRAFCTRIAPRACNASAACCGMQADKVSIQVSDSCLSQVNRITVNGEDVNADLALYGNTLVATGLQGVLSTTEGSTVCWHVPSVGVCSQPRSFCSQGRCKVEVDTSDDQCCQQSEL